MLFHRVSSTGHTHIQLTWTCCTVWGGAPAARQGVAGRLVFLFLPALLALPNRNTFLPPPPLHTRCCCRASSCLSVVSCHLESNWTWNCRFSVCVCVRDRQRHMCVCLCIWCVHKIFLNWSLQHKSNKIKSFLPGDKWQSHRRSRRRQQAARSSQKDAPCKLLSINLFTLKPCHRAVSRLPGPGRRNTKDFVTNCRSPCSCPAGAAPPTWAF